MRIDSDRRSIFHLYREVADLGRCADVGNWDSDHAHDANIGAGRPYELLIRQQVIVDAFANITIGNIASIFDHSLTDSRYAITAARSSASLNLNPIAVLGATCDGFSSQTSNVSAVQMRSIFCRARL